MSHPELLERHRKVLPSWSPLYYDEPIELVSGKGCVVTDAEGRDYLDFFGGILTTMTGHAVPEVVEAIREQAGRLLHTSTLYLIRPMVELAEKISALSTIPDAKVFFVELGHRGNRGGAVVLLRRSALQPGAGAAQQLPRAVLRRHGGHRQPVLVGFQLEPAAGQLPPQRGPPAAGLSPTCLTTSSMPPARRTCARSSRRPRPATSPASSPSPSRGWVASLSLPTASSPL